MTMLPVFSQLLAHEDLDVKIAAGENLALVYEARWSLEARSKRDEAQPSDALPRPSPSSCERGSGPAARASTNGGKTALDERSASSGNVLDREPIVPATASALDGVPRRLSKIARTSLVGMHGPPDESKTKCYPKLGDRRSHSRAEEQIVQTAVPVDLSIAPWAAQKLVALRNVPTDVMNMVRTSAQQRQELWPLTHQMIALFISSKLVDLEQNASPCAKICQQMFTCKRGIIQSKSVLANNLGIDVRSLGLSLRVLAAAVLYQDPRVCALLVSRLGAYLSDGQRLDFVYFDRQDENAYENHPPRVVSSRSFLAAK
jgi:hypothetical protein